MMQAPTELQHAYNTDSTESGAIMRHTHNVRLCLLDWLPTVQCLKTSELILSLCDLQA